MRYVPLGLLLATLGALVSAILCRSATLLIVAGVAGIAAVWLRPWERLGVFALICLAAGPIACTQITARPAIENLMPCHVAFKGRLTGSDPSQLPPGVANALSDASPIVLRYDEEAAHEHYTVPVALGLLLSPLDLLGAPLGKYTVNVKAVLTLTEGNRQLSEYRAETQASRWYGLYYGSTYRELEHEAQDAVRRVIDEAVCRDADRLAKVAGQPSNTREGGI